jgi:hypothetical protein
MTDASYDATSAKGRVPTKSPVISESCATIEGSSVGIDKN